MNNKGLSGGVVTALVMGIAGLIISIVIAFIFISTMTTADLIGNDNVYTSTVLNESVTFVATNTAQTLDAAAYADREAGASITCNSLTYIANETTTGASLGLTNITKTGCSVINATALTDFIGNGTVYVSYTYTTTVAKTKNTVNNMSTNFSAGVDNISAKVPTVLLVGAIVLILAILALLVGVWQKMRMGGSI